MHDSCGEDQAAMATRNILDRLDRVRPTTRGWSACCPAHDDRRPSLSVAEGEPGVLVKCCAGCRHRGDHGGDWPACGAPLRHLPGSKQVRSNGRTAPKRIDGGKDAGSLEDEALTLWLHANEVFAFACNLDTTAWTDNEWDVATDAICTAHEQMQRAEALEAEAFRVRGTKPTEGSTIGHASRRVKTHC